MSECPVKVSKEYLDTLPAFERNELLKAYHSWLERERKNDKRVQKNIMNRIWCFKNPELYKEIKKKVE